MNLLALLLLVAMVGRAQGDNEAAGRWSVTPHVGANLWMAKYVVKDLPVETGDKALGLTAGAELGCELAPKVNMSLGADNVRKLKVFLRDKNKNTLVFRQRQFNANALEFNYKNEPTFILRIKR